MTTFVVLGAPATKGSTVSWLTKSGRVATRTDSERLASWTEAVGWAARAAGVRRAGRDTAISLRAEFQFARPRAAKNRVYVTVRPDADKILRGLLDALTGIAYEDDAQVVQLRVVKSYGLETRTLVQIEALET